jgi:hypothetical protein
MGGKKGGAGYTRLGKGEENEVVEIPKWGPLYVVTSYVCPVNSGMSSNSILIPPLRVLCEALYPEVAAEHLTFQVKNLSWASLVTTALISSRFAFTCISQCFCTLTTPSLCAIFMLDVLGPYSHSYFLKLL